MTDADNDNELGQEMESGQSTLQITQPPAGTTSPPEQDTEQDDTDEQSKVQPASAEKDANIVLGRDEKTKQFLPALPEGPAVIGRKKVYFPSAEQQRAGFKIDKEMVNIVIGQFGQFKHYTKDKGQLPT